MTLFHVGILSRAGAKYHYDPRTPLFKDFICGFHYPLLILAVGLASLMATMASKNVWNGRKWVNLAQQH